MAPGVRTGIALIWIGLLSGCASFFGGKSQTLLIRSDSAQTADVYLDGEKIGLAPGRVQLPAEQVRDGGLLELRREGKAPQTLLLPPSQEKGWLWVDLVASPDSTAEFRFNSGFIYQPAPGHPDAARFTEK